MRVVAINEAEAIIEPFWDGSSSENPVDKNRVLDDYEIEIVPAVIGSVKQTWCSVNVVIEKAEPGQTAIQMKKKCNVLLDGYDTFRVFGSISERVSFRVTACIDGEEIVVVDYTQGLGTTAEYDGICNGKWLTELTIEFQTTETKTAASDLYWFGLSNKNKQFLMENKKSPYSKSWQGCIEHNPKNMAPEIGIYFDMEELLDLREKVKKGPLKFIMDGLREQAAKDLQISPEDDISEFIPFPDKRWCRSRDMKKTNTTEMMERLAFVGLIDENKVMLEMAVRMALSAAHCTFWCESIMGVFPGATWHHRSFTEEAYCKACALVLDWAGCYITPHGKQIIRDAIVMKGLPRIESDFKRIDYIREMNQGIVFSSGRITALRALIPAYPRYRSMLEEAEKDLISMVETYIQKDGGVLEGPHYWTYTFSNVMPLLYMLARFHKKSLDTYVTPMLFKTADYALKMLSITGNGTSFIPVNDSLVGDTMKPSVAAAFRAMTMQDEWKKLYETLVHTKKLEQDIFHLIIAPHKIEYSDRFVLDGFGILSLTGQAGCVRKHSKLGNIHFHFCSGPTYSCHFHQDKGSFILEVEDEVLAMDRGRGRYGKAELGLMSSAGWHNLLYPENPNGKAIIQPSNAPGGVVNYYSNQGETFFLSSDQTKAWEEGIFDINIRKVFSPVPELYFIYDYIKMPVCRCMSFRINTRHSIKRFSNYCCIYGEKAVLKVTPLNWKPESMEIGALGTDSDGNQVNLLQLSTDNRDIHSLITVLEVMSVKGEQDATWSYQVSDTIRVYGENCELLINTSGYDEFKIEMKQEGKNSIYFHEGIKI